MARKINATSFRLNILRAWESRWFVPASLRPRLLEEDVKIREIVMGRLKQAGIVAIEIERSANNCRILIRAARPGIVIGRGGKGIEDMTKAIRAALVKLREKRKVSEPVSINVSVMELPRGDVFAAVVAQNIAADLEKRYKFRRTMKKHLDEVKSYRNVKGVKIRIAGRLDGNEHSRAESLTHGSLPLNTLRADIDFGEASAHMTYGVLGIKVWIYKGEKFADKEKAIGGGA